MKKKILLLLFASILVFASAAVFFKAQASSSDSASGWIWDGSEDGTIVGGTIGSIDGNETGAGWISVNSTNCDTDSNGTIDSANCINDGASGGIANYGLNIPLADGDFSSPGYYAWSPNIGWISFDKNDLGGCPSGTCAARRIGNQLKGWARIIGIKDAAGAGNSGGWAGWIKLGSESGDPVTYGVTINADGTITAPNSYAWSDELGWLDFSKVIVNTNPLPTPSLVVCPSSYELKVGESYQLHAWYDPNGSGACSVGTEVTNTASWSSDNNSIVLVNTGNITGVAQGATTVWADYAGLKKPCSVTVTVPPPVVLKDCWRCDSGSCAYYQQQDACNVGDYTSQGACEAVCQSPNKWIEVAP